MPKLKLLYAPNAQLDPQQTSAICKFAKLQLVKAIVWWKVGTGKTRIGLGLLAKLFQDKPSLPCICIFVARPVFEYDLKEEILRIGLNAKISTSKNCWRIYSDAITIYFISFANLQSILNQVRSLHKFIRLVIVDELYLFSNPRTQRSKWVKRITACHNSIGLSGTILPTKDNFAVWGQTTALGLSQKLAGNATNYRSLFQTSYQSNFGRGMVRLFQNTPDWKSRVIQKLQGHIDINFPLKINNTYEKHTLVDATPLQSRLIKSLVEDFYIKFGDFEKDFNYILQTAIKIRGILNGWIETERGKFEYIPCPKLQTLSDQLEELYAAGERCIVWCAFRADVKMLTFKIPFASLQMVGGKPFEVDKWRDKAIKFVFATMGSGSSVNHFSKVEYSKFFSLSYRPIDWLQSKGRTDRDGHSGKSTCYYTYLQVRNSLDEVILRHLRSTHNSEKEFISAFELWTKQLLHSDRATIT